MTDRAAAVTRGRVSAGSGGHASRLRRALAQHTDPGLRNPSLTVDERQRDAVATDPSGPLEVGTRGLNLRVSLPLKSTSRGLSISTSDLIKSASGITADATTGQLSLELDTDLLEVNDSGGVTLRFSSDNLETAAEDGSLRVSPAVAVANLNPAIATLADTIAKVNELLATLRTAILLET